MIVGYIVDYYSNKIVFIIIGLLSIFSLILSCTMSIDEKTFAPSKTVTNKVMKTSFSGFSLLLIIMLLVNIIQTTVSAPLWEIVIPLYTSELFEKATITIGVLYSIDSFFSIAASFFFGKEADKRNPYILGVFIMKGKSKKSSTNALKN